MGKIFYKVLVLKCYCNDFNRSTHLEVFCKMIVLQLQPELLWKTCERVHFFSKDALQKTNFNEKVILHR